MRLRPTAGYLEQRELEQTRNDRSSYEEAEKPAAVSSETEKKRWGRGKGRYKGREEQKE